ncbi:hypothetical protein ANDA3_3426 [plant metagenome]|uniref:Chlorhexidine efflux transporter domain-containing protein n=3 Tax=root TaxID=1 RepID=A0A1C3JY00_9BURK|nr:multidrug/biocide efflux PACE transporter [Orrella dioscoreae]SBT24139.1 hypothetical protein ODI_02227 [Orrella dioscoreae]SOE51418.1 hypothetical protein ODI_R3428 [Orrella dioscoreae]
MTVPKKSLAERVLHAALFEIMAVALCAPTLAWLMGKPLLSMGILTGAISLVAMAWNMIYNAAFERVERARGWVRNTGLRVAHALGFEAGLILAIVPMAAWWLSISLWEAFLLDIGLLLFFLPYTYLYNLGYDRARAAYWRNRGYSGA